MLNHPSMGFPLWEMLRGRRGKVERHQRVEKRLGLMCGYGGLGRGEIGGVVGRGKIDLGLSGMLGKIRKNKE